MKTTTTRYAEMMTAEILTTLCAILRIEGASVVAEGEGARVAFTQPLYGEIDASAQLFACAGACGLYMDPDASVGAPDDEAEVRRIDYSFRPRRESATETAPRPAAIEGATLVYADGSRLPLAEWPGIDARWLAPAGLAG